MESQQNVGKLTRDLKALKYQNLDVFSVKDGDPIVFLQIIQFLLDIHLIKDVGFFGTTDEQFINKFYLLLRDRFNYKPKLSQTQFFKPGFVNAKCELAIDFIKMLKDEKNMPNGASSQEKLDLKPQEKPSNLPELTPNDSLLHENVPLFRDSNQKKKGSQPMITGFENTEVSVVSEDDKYSPSIRSIGQPAPPGFIFSFDEIRALDGQESPSMEFKNDSMFSQEHQDLFKSENTREHSLYSEDSLKNKQKVVDAIINGKQQKNDNEKSISWGSSTSEYYLQRYFQGFKDTEKHIYSVASSVRSNDIPEEMHIDPVSLGSSLDHEHFQAARRRKSGMNTPQPSQIPSAITVIKDKTPKQKGSLRGFHKEKAADAVAEEPSVQIQWELMYKKMNSIEEKLDQYNNSQSQLQKTLNMILENGKRMEDVISSLRQTAAVPDMNLDKSFISMIPQEPDKSLDVSRSTLDFKLAMTDKSKNNTTDIITSVEKKLQDTMQLLDIE